MPDPETAAVGLLSELVGIDSVNPGLVPGAAGESQIVRHLETRLQRSGFTTSVVPARGAGDRPSLVAVPPSRPEWPVVVLNGHLDTVGVSGMTEPFEPRVEIVSLDAERAPEDASRLDLRLVYRVRSSRREGRLDLPLWLTGEEKA